MYRYFAVVTVLAFSCLLFAAAPAEARGRKYVFYNPAREAAQVNYRYAPNQMPYVWEKHTGNVVYSGSPYPGPVYFGPLPGQPNMVYTSPGFGYGGPIVTRHWVW